MSGWLRIRCLHVSQFKKGGAAHTLEQLRGGRSVFRCTGLAPDAPHAAKDRTIMSTLKITQPAHSAARSGLGSSIARHPLVAFFILAFIITWLPVLPMTLSRNAGVGLLPYT